jgi:hypothetical protein
MPGLVPNHCILYYLFVFLSCALLYLLLRCATKQKPQSLSLLGFDFVFCVNCDLRLSQTPGARLIIATTNYEPL